MAKDSKAWTSAVRPKENAAPLISAAISKRPLLSRLELRARRDDGLIICLDGKEIIRDNIAAGADSWQLDALQGVNEEEIKATMAWPIPGELPAGDHVLAISLHNYGNDSSDLCLGHVTLVELEPGQ